MRQAGASMRRTKDVNAAGKARGLYFFIPNTVDREERMKEPALKPVK